jgi:hypothetical protein
MAELVLADDRRTYSVGMVDPEYPDGCWIWFELKATRRADAEREARAKVARVWGAAQQLNGEPP